MQKRTFTSRFHFSSLDNAGKRSFYSEHFEKIVERRSLSISEIIHCEKHEYLNG